MTLHRQIRRTQPGEVRHSITLGPARLYLEDLEAIVETLKDFASTAVEAGATEPPAVRHVTIQAADAVADAVEDLKEATTAELNEVKVYVNGPSAVDLSLGNSHARIEVDAGDPDARALASDLAVFIGSRRSYTPPLRMYPGADLFALALTCAVVAGGAIALLQGSRWTSTWWFAAVSVVLFNIGNLGINYFQARRLGCVEVVPERRKEKTRLSRQVRRDLVVVLVGAVVGGTLAGFLGLWQGMLAK
ncbi:hypothetical protein O7635_33415 [Asanoa sp. WMMD1127]|uniref:hypothetical protein n=1 Tax=Asanoa sp. WMMD1127 TaxID=3016107 RepID=UPI002415AA17|nr:hypothetical protein [Asanoa sp. WMMD1127]MDG4826776.1 hypothetical protein [Asanoa sp. WMMD1127]